MERSRRHLHSVGIAWSSFHLKENFRAAFFLVLGVLGLRGLLFSSEGAARVRQDKQVCGRSPQLWKPPVCSSSSLSSMRWISSNLMWWFTSSRGSLHFDWGSRFFTTSWGSLHLHWGSSSFGRRSRFSSFLAASPPNVLSEFTSDTESKSCWDMTSVNSEIGYQIN